MYRKFKTKKYDELEIKIKKKKQMNLFSYEEITITKHKTWGFTLFLFYQNILKGKVFIQTKICSRSIIKSFQECFILLNFNLFSYKLHGVVVNGKLCKAYKLKIITGIYSRRFNFDETEVNNKS